MRILTAFLLLLLGACQAAPGADFALTDKRSPALWRVTDPVGGNSGYLFGTIHMLPANVEWQSTTLLRALEASDRLVKELPPGDAPSAIDDPSGTAGNEPVSPIAERLSPDQYRAFRALAADLPYSQATLDALESWAVALLLSRSNVGTLDIETLRGVDAVLEAKFGQGRRPIVGLDSADEQLARFDDLPQASQNLLLRLALDDAGAGETLEKEYGEMVNRWLSGDIAAIAATNDGPFADPVIQEALIERPNRKWALLIGRMLRSGERPFVAVGARHLAGDAALPALLKAQGLTVERIQ